MNLESEISESLYIEMKGFIGANPNWDQCSLMSTALANFLIKNGSKNRAVRETYLKDLFNRSG